MGRLPGQSPNSKRKLRPAATCQLDCQNPAGKKTKRFFWGQAQGRCPGAPVGPHGGHGRALHRVRRLPHVHGGRAAAWNRLERPWPAEHPAGRVRPSLRLTDGGAHRRRSVHGERCVLRLRPPRGQMQPSRHAQGLGDLLGVQLPRVPADGRPGRAPSAVFPRLRGSWASSCSFGVRVAAKMSNGPRTLKPKRRK